MKIKLYASRASKELFLAADYKGNVQGSSVYEFDLTVPDNLTWVAECGHPANEDPYQTPGGVLRPCPLHPQAYQRQGSNVDVPPSVKYVSVPLNVCLTCTHGAATTPATDTDRTVVLGVLAAALAIDADLSTPEEKDVRRWKVHWERTKRC